MNNEIEHISPDPEVTRLAKEEFIHLGDWYWVKDPHYREDDHRQYIVRVADSTEVIPSTQGQEPPEKEDKWLLMCVAHVGSNFVRFRAELYGKGSTSQEVHMDELDQVTKHEPNWRDYIQNRIKESQEAMKATMQLIADHAEALYLTPGKAPESGEVRSSLPSTMVADPSKYKKQLVVAKDETFPQLTEQVSALSDDLATQTRNMYLPDVVKMQKLKSVIHTVEDKIFTVELYVGMEEDIAQIKEGEPAPADEPIHIRQMLLYMDEETLIDYDKAGADFSSLKKFDAWIAKAKNLNRIIPETRGIVAMRVRRNKKDYGDAASLAEAWTMAGWADQDKKTYLVVRNGEQVYRIFTALDFCPRLVPMRNELSQQFRKVHTAYNSDTRKQEVKEDRIITPDDIEYDRYVLDHMSTVLQYNRIILILQGLIDRTKIFQSMPRINLASPSDGRKWMKIIRDEESLPSRRLIWETYRDQLNKTIKKGKVICLHAQRMTDKWRSEFWWDTRPAWLNPQLFEVEAVKRDRSEVQVGWPHVYSYGYYDPDTGCYKGGQPSGKRSHCWIPMEHVFNVTDYMPGDYKMFLCNRAARGKYLKWAPFLLSAENYKNGKEELATEMVVRTRVERW